MNLLRIPAILCAVFSAASVAHAQLIAPVLVELSPARRVVSVTMTNRSDQAMTYQSQALAWTQVDGADRQSETNDILVVPPIAQLPPGGTQLFRVTLRRPLPAQETAYRLVFEDITSNTGPAGDGATVRLQFRHSLPVFAGSVANAQARPVLDRCTAPGKSACVRIRNDGDRRLKVATLVAEGGGWRGEFKVSATVLAGGWKQVTFDAPANVPGPFTITAQTSAGKISTELARQQL